MNQKLFKYSALYCSLFLNRVVTFIPATVLLGAMASSAVYAEDNVSDDAVSFNAGFVASFDKNLDAARFDKESNLPVGDYQLDIYINNRFTGRGFARISQDKENASAVCFRGKDVATWGLNLSKLSDPGKVTALLASDCVQLALLLPESRVDIDPATLQANLSIPQIYLNSRVGSYVAPEYWDEGINAGFISYSANAYETSSSQRYKNRNYYVGLNTGLNLLGWNIRHNGSLTASQLENSVGHSNHAQYNSISTYAQRGVGSIASMVTVGQYYTPGDLFDAVPFTGIQMASDERMLPYSEKGFAPEIRGIAETNAKITVRQGTQIVYETTVAPGPFAINDLTNTGYAGDLNVTITESDGKTKTFIVPYASVGQLLRPGTSRYSATAGQYRATGVSDDLTQNPAFVQGTYRRGLNNRITAYGGGIAASEYASWLAGIALNTAMGAFAFDITTSHARGLPETKQTDRTMNGQSYRVTYSNRLDATKTELALAAYRFSSSDFLTLQNFAELKGRESGNSYRPRERLQINISQPIGDWGNLYLSGSTESSWSRKGRSTTYQAGYGTSFTWGIVNLSVSRTYSGNGYDNRLALMYSLPFGGTHGANLSTSLNLRDKGQYNVQSNLSGSLGERNQMNYNGYAGYNHSATTTRQQYGGSVNYTGALSAVGAGASHSSDSTQYSLSARGTVIGYSGGIAMTPSQGETMAVVEAKGASGAQVLGGSGGTVGWWGNTVITSLTPYQNNSLLVDAEGGNADVEIENGSVNTVPRYGAISRLKFDTIVGTPLIVRGVLTDGSPVPFGADVFDKDQQRVSMTGQGGQMLLRGLPDKGQLQVKWGDSASESCSISYSVPESAPVNATGFSQIDALCK